MRSFGWSLAAVWLLLGVFLFALNAFGATNAPVKRVLILHSFGRDFAPYNAVSSGFRTELARQSAAPIEFLEASLETARFSESGSETPFVEYLRALFADRPPNLVVSFGAPAMNFLRRHGERLFPGVPILVSAVDQRHLGDASVSANATAVSVRLDLPGIVENILHVLPRTKSIAVVIGNSPLEKFWLTELRQELQSFTNHVQFTWLNELSFESMRKRLAELPPSSAILYAILLVDAAGVPHEQERALDILHKESNAPIFGAFDSQLGRGIVGGPLYPTQEVSRESVRLAQRILGGESPRSMQPLSLGPATPVYDWRELKRWGISEGRLPPGHVLQFRPPSVWQQYKWYIIGALIIIAIQATIIADLLLERSRRRHAERELRENQKFMELATDAGELSLWVRDLKDGNLWANHWLRYLLGLHENDSLQFAQILARIHPDDRDRMAVLMERTPESRLPIDAEFRVLLPSGSYRWLLARSQVVHDPQGHILRRMGTMIDVTERKRAEEKLRDSEQNFRRLVETTAAVPWQADAQTWVFTYVGPQAVKLLGYPQDQWYEKDFWVSHLHPDDKEFAVNTCSTLSKSAEDFEFEYRMIANSGKTVWVHDVVTPEHRDGKPAQLRGLMLDITERKQAVESLREREEHYRTLAETAADVIVTMDQNSTILFVNAAVERVFGYMPTELVGQKITMLMPEPLRQRHIEGMRRYLETGEKLFSWGGVSFPGLHKSGREINLEIAFAESRVSDRRVFTGIIRDITERNRAELEAAQQRAELAHMARVSTMGELATSVAHELNQPLGAILSNAEAAEMFLDQDPPGIKDVREILTDIRKDDQRAGEVIQRMRALLRKRELELQQLDINELVQDVLKLVGADAVLRKTVISSDLIWELPPISGDRVHLQQVLLNLVLNGMDATAEQPADTRRLAVCTKKNDNGEVEVAVTDAGPGVMPDKLSRVFEPFFTTKRDGMGMGLAISQNIIETHRGRIWAENNPGGGATFRFTLPVVAEESDAGRV